MSTVLAATATVLVPVPRMIPLNGTPAKGADGKVIYPYGVFSGSMGRGDQYALDATYGIRYGRVVVQTFGKTAEAAEDHMDKVVAELLDQTLTIAGFDASPCQLELDPVMTRDPDDAGVVGLTASFTFTATKES